MILFEMFKKYRFEDIPNNVKYCLFLGAKLIDEKHISPILELRLKVAEEMYKKRNDIIFNISGCIVDAEKIHKVIKEHGVIPDSALLVDKKGTITYNSIVGMKEKIGNEPFMILTSSFHRPRCTYIALALGCDVYPIDISQNEKKVSFRYYPREVLAFVKAFYLVRIRPLFIKQKGKV